MLGNIRPKDWGKNSIVLCIYRFGWNMKEQDRIFEESGVDKSCKFGSSFQDVLGEKAF
jgi:hypothetical protein